MTTIYDENEDEDEDKDDMQTNKKINSTIVKNLDSLTTVHSSSLVN